MAVTLKDFKKNEKIRTLIATIRLASMSFLPMVLLVLPSDYFDHGRSICLFTILSGYECWGCGITRACMHMIHFDFRAAWDFNKLVVIVLPILIGLYLQQMFHDFIFIRHHNNKNKSAESSPVEESIL